MEKPSKNHPFFAILFRKVRGSVGSRFSFQAETGGSVSSRFGFGRFGRFEFRYFWFDPTLITTYTYVYKLFHDDIITPSSDGNHSILTWRGLLYG